MPTSLSWPVAAVVVAVVGAITYLGADHVMGAADITTILVLILGAVGIVAGTHVGAQAGATVPGPAETPAAVEKLV